MWIIFYRDMLFYFSFVVYCKFMICFRDVKEVIEGLYGDDPPPIILIGHR